MSQVYWAGCSSIQTRSRQIKIGEVEQIDLKRSIELLELLLQIPFLSVPKCRPDAECHETERRKQENHDPFADGSLPILGGRLGCAVTHGAGLTESRRDPQQKGKGKNSDAWLHLTPSEMMRRASGKKIIIKARQATREHMVSHFMREISYFMCMK